jgi:predicted GNAT family acetyltransferase
MAARLATGEWLFAWPTLVTLADSGDGRGVAVGHTRCEDQAVEIQLTDAAERSRYEAHLDGELAGFILYRRSDERIALVHTEVAPAFEGKGIAAALARHALDDARAAGLQVRPLCPFVAAWISRHLDYLDIVDPVDRDRVASAEKA